MFNIRRGSAPRRAAQQAGLARRPRDFLRTGFALHTTGYKPFRSQSLPGARPSRASAGKALQPRGHRAAAHARWAASPGPHGSQSQRSGGRSGHMALRAAATCPVRAAQKRKRRYGPRPSATSLSAAVERSLREPQAGGGAHARSAGRGRRDGGSVSVSTPCGAARRSPLVTRSVLNPCGQGVRCRGGHGLPSAGPLPKASGGNAPWAGTPRGCAAGARGRAAGCPG